MRCKPRQVRTRRADRQHPNRPQKNQRAQNQKPFGGGRRWRCACSINNTQTVIDLIQPDYKAIVVSRHYLGSINHTLLTIEALRNRNLTIAGIVFNGYHPPSEQIILSKTQIPLIGTIANEPYFDQNVIAEYAELFRENLLKLS
jgi:hypothetical protein